MCAAVLFHGDIHRYVKMKCLWYARTGDRPEHRRRCVCGGPEGDPLTLPNPSPGRSSRIKEMTQLGSFP